MVFKQRDTLAGKPLHACSYCHFLIDTPGVWLYINQKVSTNSALRSQVFRLRDHCNSKTYQAVCHSPAVSREGWRGWHNPDVSPSWDTGPGLQHWRKPRTGNRGCPRSEVLNSLTTPTVYVIASCSNFCISTYTSKAYTLVLGTLHNATTMTTASMGYGHRCIIYVLSWLENTIVGTCIIYLLCSYINVSPYMYQQLLH